MDPEPYDVLAVELSSFQLHYTDSMSAESAAVLNVAEDHLDWYAGLGDGRLRRRQGPHLRAGPARLRLQRRRPGDRAAGPRGRRRRGRPRDRLHPRHARRRHGRRGRRHPRRPGLHRGARHQRRRAVHDRRPGLARPALRRQRAGRGRPGPRPRRLRRRRCATGCGPSGPTGTGSPTVAEVDGGDLGRRLQGHQPARRPVLAAGATTRWSGSPAGWPRAPGSTTWSSAVRDRLRGVVLLGRGPRA